MNTVVSFLKAVPPIVLRLKLSTGSGRCPFWNASCIRDEKCIHQLIPLLMGVDVLESLIALRVCKGNSIACKYNPTGLNEPHLFEYFLNKRKKKTCAQSCKHHVFSLNIKQCSANAKLRSARTFNCLILEKISLLLLMSTLNCLIIECNSYEFMLITCRSCTHSAQSWTRVRHWVARPHVYLCQKHDVNNTWPWAQLSWMYGIDVYRNQRH